MKPIRYYSQRCIELMGSIENALNDRVSFEYIYPELTTAIHNAIDTENLHTLKVLNSKLCKLLDSIKDGSTRYCHECDLMEEK